MDAEREQIIISDESLAETVTLNSLQSKTILVDCDDVGFLGTPVNVCFNQLTSSLLEQKEWSVFTGTAEDN